MTLGEFERIRKDENIDLPPYETLRYWLLYEAIKKYELSPTASAAGD